MQTPGASVIGQTLHISLQPRPGSSQAGASTGRNLKKNQPSLIPRIKDGWFQGLEHFSATTAGTLDSAVPLAPESQVYLPWQFSCFLRFITLCCTSEPGRDSVSLHATDLRPRHHLVQGWFCPCRTTPKGSPAPPGHSLLESCSSHMDVFTSPPGQAYMGQSLSNSPAGESALEDGAGCFSSKSLLNPPSALGDPS